MLLQPFDHPPRGHWMGALSDLKWLTICFSGLGQPCWVVPSSEYTLLHHDSIHLTFNAELTSPGYSYEFFIMAWNFLYFFPGNSSLCWNNAVWTQWLLLSVSWKRTKDLPSTLNTALIIPGKNDTLPMSSLLYLLSDMHLEYQQSKKLSRKPLWLLLGFSCIVVL